PYLQYIGWLLNIYKLTNKIHTNFIHNRNLIRCSIALQRLPLLVSFHKGFQISGLVFHDIPTSINPLIDHYCSLFPLIFHLAFLIFSFLFLILLPSRTTLVFTVLLTVYFYSKYQCIRFFHDIPTSINPLIDHYCSLFPLIFHLAFLIFSFLFLILLPSRTTLVYTVLHTVYAHPKYPRNRFLHLDVHKNREL